MWAHSPNGLETRMAGKGAAMRRSTSWTKDTVPKTIGPGRPKIPQDIKEAARAFSPMALETLAHWAERKKSHPASIAAANALLDRAYGKPSQEITGKDGGPLFVPTVRIIVGGVGAAVEVDASAMVATAIIPALTNGHDEEQS